MNNNFICGNVGVGCLITLAGECVNYTGETITHPLVIPKNANLNVVVNNIANYLSTVSVEKVYYRTDIISEQSDSDLNLLYPSTPINTKVICPNISTGGLLYWKVDSTSWIHLCMNCGSTPPISPLIVNAGNNQSLTAGTTTTTLDGSATTDVTGVINTILWEIVSGPNTPVITNPASLTSTVTGLISGTTVLKLTVSDSLGRVNSDTVDINIGVPSLILINTGTDQNLPGGTTSTTVTASLTVPVGVTIQSQTWTII